MESDPNRRRGARIDAPLRVRLVGLDDAPQERTCNISISGVYIEFEGYQGSSGTVERLEIETLDGAYRAMVLAVVVRVVTVDDLWQGARVRGAAFEFLLDDAIQQEALRQLVRSVAGEVFARDGDLEGLSLGAKVDAGAAQGSATLASLKNEAIVLETNWPVERGAGVHLVVETPGQAQPVEITGVVHKTTRDEDQRYRVEVRLGGRFDEATSGEDLNNAMNALLSEVVTPKAPSRLQQASADLSGSLEQVPLPSVLSFIEMERLNGCLRLDQGQHSVTVYLGQGRVLDVEGAEDPEAGRALLRQALERAGGTFRLELGAVDRPDRFSTSASALVLDLLREIDESRS